MLNLRNIYWSLFKFRFFYRKVHKEFSQRTQKGVMMNTNDKNRERFNSIAKTYDKLNHRLSFRFDVYWRKRALKKHISSSSNKVVDIACGTGDFAIQAAKFGAKEIIGIDLSENMLEIANAKIKRKNLERIISVQTGSCANIEFDDNTFDIATIAFGVRNFEDLEVCLKEVLRVLKDEGKIIILEFTIPRNRFFRGIYTFYINNILPIIGKRISGDKDAYTYLPNSIGKFLQYDDFVALLNTIGFNDVSYKPLTMGIACVYCGRK